MTVPTISAARGEGRVSAMKRPWYWALASWGFRLAMWILMRI